MSGGVLASADIAEIWGAVRDAARPETEEEAESLASVYAPPTPEEWVRIKRLDRDGRFFRDEMRPKLRETEHTRRARKQLDQIVYLKAFFGGSPTVKPL